MNKEASTCSNFCNDNISQMCIFTHEVLLYKTMWGVPIHARLMHNTDICILFIYYIRHWFLSLGHPIPRFKISIITIPLFISDREWSFGFYCFMWTTWLLVVSLGVASLIHQLLFSPPRAEFFISDNTFFMESEKVGVWIEFLGWEKQIPCIIFIDETGVTGLARKKWEGLTCSISHY